MDVRLPPLGEGVEKAKVAKVHVRPGAAVKEGELLLEVETDKATMEVPAPSAGTVERLSVKEGDEVKPGDVIATFVGGNGQKSAVKAPQTGGTAPTAPQPKPAASPQVSTPPPDTPAPTGAKTRLEFKCPNLGEGVKSAKVSAVLVKAGESVDAGQPLLEAETDKATFPVPAPGAGTVVELQVKPGQEISEGMPLAVLEVLGGPQTRSAPQKSAPAQPAPAGDAGKKPAPEAIAARAPSTNGDAGTGDKSVVPAGPATRRLARELGVDLRAVRGSARGGRVTLDDVKAFVRGNGGRPTAVAAPASGGFVLPTPTLPDFAKWGPVERKKISGVRKKTAENMTISWLTCASVTQYDQADITELEAGRKRFVETQPKDAAKVTMTVLILKAVVAALKQFPQFNASFDAAADELVFKQYYHIGVAVDTEHGLFVPVIRDVDKKSVAALAKELTDKAALARTKKLPLEDMRGGTFTLTNLGGVGGTAFSPIINYPEVAILGVSRSSMQPVWRGDKFEPRLMMPLSLTYDHRVVDGADGARFTTYLARTLSDPVRLLIEG